MNQNKNQHPILLKSSEKMDVLSTKIPADSLPVVYDNRMIVECYSNWNLLYCIVLYFIDGVGMFFYTYNTEKAVFKTTVSSKNFD